MPLHLVFCAMPILSYLTKILTKTLGFFAYSMPLKSSVFAVGSVLFIFLSSPVIAQNTADSLAKRQAVKVDTTSLKSLVPDSTRADSLLAFPATKDSMLNSGASNNLAANAASNSAQSSQKGSVEFQASDSLTFRLKGNRQAKLYGRAQVTHEAGRLSAGLVSLNLDSSLVSAKSLNDADTLSYPILERESDRIRSNRILFNYETNKGKFNQAEITVPQGKLRGGQVKNTSQEVVFVRDGIYAPCDVPVPNYYIKARRMKVVDQEQIFFTDAMLYIMDIPYPFVFPFGYIPSNIEERESGLLTPTYAFQDQNNRGLGVTNMGWFQVFSEYLTGQASVDFFTSGSYNFDTQANYNNKAKRFSGNVQYGFSNIQGLEPTDPNYTQSRQQNFALSHSQDISPFARISANINLRTSQYNQQNSFNIDDRAEVSTTSRLNYTYRHPESIYSINVNADQSSNFATGVTSLTLPSATFRIQPITPFQKEGSGTNAKWYESVTINYDNTLNTNYRFSPVDSLNTENINWIDALFDREKYEAVTNDDRHFQSGFRQAASINGNLFASGTTTGTASIRYNEYWYPSTIRRSVETNENGQQISVDERVTGFASARTFDSSFNVATTIYGISQQRIGAYKGFRHTMRPTIGFTYTPDFSDEQWGYFRPVEGDTTGRTYSIFDGGIVGGPTAGRSQSLTFSVNNSLETKKVDRDSTGVKKEETIRLIDNFSFNTSYNFAAERNQLANLSSNLRSNILNQIAVTVSANFDFYAYDSTGVRTNNFLFSESRKPFLLNNLSVRASTRFSGGPRGVKAEGIPYPAFYDPLDQSIFGAIQPGFNEISVEPYRTDWSFSLNLDYSIRRQFNRTKGTFEFQRTATVNIPNIAFKLTPKWAFTTSIGYEFIEKELTPSRFQLRRSLECWDLSFTVNPFGEFQFYLFTLTVTDTKMNSLFNKLPILRNLQRSNTPINRLGF